MRVALLASLFASALVACDVGEVPLNGGTGTDAGSGSGSADPMASARFMSDVQPMLDAAGCMTGGAGGLCHGNVQPPILTSFEAMTANGANPTYARKPGAMNKLVTGPTLDMTGKHPISQPAMAIPYLDAAQKMTITTWIDMYGFSM